MSDVAELTGCRRFVDQVVLITGGARGMGAAEARLFAAEGAKVVITDVLDPEGEALAAEISAGGGTALYRHLDVVDEDAWLGLVSEVDDSFGRLDVLVNNAGVSDRRGLFAMDLDAWDPLMDINVWGPVLGMRSVAPVMARHGGAIVNISSVAGMTGYDAAAYTSSKWALRGLTKLAANEFVDLGIRVNSVHPGTIDTPMLANTSREVIANYVRVTPMRRAGVAEEIASAVVFVASRDASFVTGAELAVDGGFVSGGANMSFDLRVRAQAGGGTHE